MKNNYSQLGWKAALLLALWLCAPVSAQAQIKIGTVNLRKVFESYWKTKQADEDLKERRAASEKIWSGMLEDFKRDQGEYNKLRAAANDQTLSKEEQDKRRKQGEAKLNELRESERSMAQYKTEAEKQLNDTMLRRRDGILTQIREMIVTKAKAGTFNLILDTSAESADRIEIVLFSSGFPDLTDEILTDLNSTAPAPLTPAPAEKPGAKSDKK